MEATDSKSYKALYGINKTQPWARFGSGLTSLQPAGWKASSSCSKKLTVLLPPGCQTCNPKRSGPISSSGASTQAPAGPSDSAPWYSPVRLKSKENSPRARGPRIFKILR